MKATHSWTQVYWSSFFNRAWWSARYDRWRSFRLPKFCIVNQSVLFNSKIHICTKAHFITHSFSIRNMSLPCAKANGPFVVFVVDVVDVIANISIYVDSSNEFQVRITTTTTTTTSIATMVVVVIRIHWRPPRLQFSALIHLLSMNERMMNDDAILTYIVKFLINIASR